jgi:hypothetical protein
VLGRAVLLHRLGVSALQRGELQRARELTEASDQLYVQSGDAWGRTLTVGQVHDESRYSLGPASIPSLCSACGIP